MQDKFDKDQKLLRNQHHDKMKTHCDKMKAPQEQLVIIHQDQTTY